MIAIIVSAEDIAGVNMRPLLIEKLDLFETDMTYKSTPVFSRDNISLFMIPGPSIYADYLSDIPADLFIFASRHTSAKEMATLTTHVHGNWGPAEAGGKPRELAIAPASAMKVALQELNHQKNHNSLDYDVRMEVTHHGPFLVKPSIWVEVGGSMRQWQDMDAISAAVEAILAVIHNSVIYPAVFGIGGPHYAPRFTKIMLDTQYAVGHICPKYALQYLDADLLKQAISRTVEPIEKIVLDWKGLGPNPGKQKVLDLLSSTDIPIVRDKELIHENV